MSRPPSQAVIEAVEQAPMPDLCAHHATILASRHLAHLDPDEHTRLARDLSQQCPDCRHPACTRRHEIVRLELPTS